MAILSGFGELDDVMRLGDEVNGLNRWIAKMVGKITRKLEEARGDVGYSGDIPVALEKYRNQALPGEKLDKILP